jgi:hypothetical protein
LSRCALLTWPLHYRDPLMIPSLGLARLRTMVLRHPRAVSQCFSSYLKAGGNVRSYSALREHLREHLRGVFGSAPPWDLRLRGVFGATLRLLGCSNVRSYSAAPWGSVCGSANISEGCSDLLCASLGSPRGVRSYSALRTSPRGVRSYSCIVLRHNASNWQ